MKYMKRIAALAAGMMMLLPGAEAADFEAFLREGTVPSLKEHYAGRLTIGIPAEELLEGDEAFVRLAATQCNMLDCEKQTGGAEMIDRGTSKKSKDPDRAKVMLMEAKTAMTAAADHQMTARAATVVNPERIPRWFFTENWAMVPKGALVDRETGRNRMKHAIEDQMEKLNEAFPGVITEWTVVRRKNGSEEDLFLEVMGEEYIREAFETARLHCAENQKLFYGCDEIPDGKETDRILKLHEDGLADGIILDCRFNADAAEIDEAERALRVFAESGLEIRLSNLEISETDRTAEGQMKLASLYKAAFGISEHLTLNGESAVKGIALAGLQDRDGRKEGNGFPRLFNRSGKCTAAFFGALQDEDVPLPGGKEEILRAAEKLGLDEYLKKEESPVTVYKTIENHNPVMVQRFGADPWAMVYRDRVYLYMTGDEPAAGEGEKPKTNNYSNIVTLRVLSSEDLVNWTDHGSIRAAGAGGAARWASNSWAPCAAWKTLDGQDRFFLYFANSGGGIGVLTADSPTGPFTDPIGKPLISRATPTCAEVTWLFDPAVLVDSDGSAYLYFGGGIPEGKASDPGTARMVKLGEDMISLAEDPIPFHPPWLFEDSGINRFGSTYVYSYCSNFNVPSGGSEQGFGSGEIVYMTSEDPLGPYTYAGRVLPNPGSFFGTGGNNHHCMFEFRGKWYITYHAATLDKAMGWNAGYRSTFVDELSLTEDGLPALTRGTYEGVGQVKKINPYDCIPGATAVSMAGVTTELAYAEDKTAGTGKMMAVSTAPGGWTALAGVDFGSEGASSVRLLARSEVPAKIEIIPDDLSEKPVAILEIPAAGTDTEIRADLATKMTGVHDLFFRFTERGTGLLEGQFQ